MLDSLIQKNPNIMIRSIDHPSFRKYGRILDENDFVDVFEYLNKHTQVPEKENNYLAHDSKLEDSVYKKDGIYNVFGDMPVQYGYVNGNNRKLNALEYHKSSEINICLSPLVLMLAKTSDIKKNQIKTEKLIAYYVPAYTAIEIFSQTLHFSPCRVLDSGFKCGVILPYGTNMNFIKAKNQNIEENQLLFKTNKWLIAHKEHQRFIDLGAHVGIIGENIEINY